MSLPCRRRRRPLGGWVFVAAVLAPVVLAAAQGRRSDYQRSARLRVMTRNKVFRDRVQPDWSDDGKRLWYRVQTGPDRCEFVVVDTARGVRRPAFDHDRLAKALGEAGVRGARPDRLPISQFQLDADGRGVALRSGRDWWRCDLKTYKVRKLAGAKGLGKAEALRPVGSGPKASRRSATETEVTFLNLTKGQVQLLWLDMAGQRRSYGRIAPGGQRRQHTYAGHVWLVVDAAGKSLGAGSGL